MTRPQARTDNATSATGAKTSKSGLFVAQQQALATHDHGVEVGSGIDYLTVPGIPRVSSRLPAGSGPWLPVAPPGSASPAPRAGRFAGMDLVLQAPTPSLPAPRTQRQSVSHSEKKPPSLTEYTALAVNNVPEGGWQHTPNRKATPCPYRTWLPHPPPPTLDTTDYVVDVPRDDSHSTIRCAPTRGGCEARDGQQPSGSLIRRADAGKQMAAPSLPSLAAFLALSCLPSCGRAP